MILGIVAVVAVLGLGLIVFAMSQGGGEPDPSSSKTTSPRTSTSIRASIRWPVKPPKIPPHSLPLKTPSVPYHSRRPAHSDKLPNTECAFAGGDNDPSIARIQIRLLTSRFNRSRPTILRLVKLPPSPPSETRKPVPDQAAQTKALATVHEVLKDDYAKAVTLEARADLVRKLIKLANDTNDDANLRYVMGTQATRPRGESRRRPIWRSNPSTE